MSKPFLSLILTSYNLERYIREALLSALAQDYDGPMELIVVDDASTDRSAEIIQSVLQEAAGAWKVLFLRQERNGGVAQAVDAALAHANGEWAVFMDGDDIQMPDRCRHTAELIARHPRAVLINMAAELIDGEGRLYGKKSYAFAPFDKAAPELLCATAEERLRNYLTFDDNHIDAYGCTMAVRLDVCRLWGALGEGMAQDTPWALRAYLCGEVLGSIYLACRYRSHSTNLLNREWEGGIVGVRRQELFQAGYQTFFAATHRRMLADALRAQRDASLTDWDTAGLAALVAHERRELRVAELRSNWWGISWPRRVCRALRSIGRVPWRMAMWPWLRLLPLALVCRVRALKMRG